MSPPPPEKPQRVRRHVARSPETAEERSARLRREKRNLMLFVVAMLAFGGLCWLVFPHASAFAHTWLARRHLPEVRENLKEQKWREAAVAMNNARRWAPQDPEVIRASLEFLHLMGEDSRTAISLVRQLQDTGAATNDDVMLMGQMHARLGELAKARGILEKLPVEARQTRRGLELQAEILRAEGSTAEADSLLRKALEQDSNNPDSLLKLARMDLASKDPARRAAIHDRLWKMAHIPGPSRLTAVELLAGSRALTVPQAEELSKIVDSIQTDSTQEREQARLNVLSARIRLSPHLRADIIDAELPRWKDRPPAQTVPVVAWLSALGEYERILRILPAPTAVRNAELLPHHVEALCAKGKWQELDTLLSTNRLPSTIPALRVMLWQARARMHLDSSPANARRLLARVFESSGHGDSPLFTLETGALAEQLHEWDLARDCYQAVAAKHPASRQQLLPKVYEMAEHLHDGEEMLKVCSQLLELAPESTPQLIQKLYLQLLLGIDLETAQVRLQSLTLPRQVQQADRLHLLHALAAFRQHDAAGIRSAIPQISNPAALSVGERAVYASLLKFSGGDTAAVFRIMERIPSSLLLPEERMLANRAR
ncbi:MAG: hypothetical protein U1F71_23065 [Verrucomicrobiaceae bacterium]